MLAFKEFKTYNQYLGLREPFSEDLDVGYYPENVRVTSGEVVLDFYRISIKSNFVDKAAPGYDPQNRKPITAVFFNSPGRSGTWDVEPSFEGMYVQISKKLIEENRFLFKTYLDYGDHEPLLLASAEEQEIRTIFALMIKYYEAKHNNFNVLLSYVHVLISLVEAFYQRQFSANPKQYNYIISNFQQRLNEYYNKSVSKLPTVQYFAEKLDLSPNYLGDLVKHFTNKAALDTIHEFVIKRAKALLVGRVDLNNTEIAYELGFEYPNYFAKFFKKHVGITPREYRSKFQRSHANQGLK